MPQRHPRRTAHAPHNAAADSEEVSRARLAVVQAGEGATPGSGERVHQIPELALVLGLRSASRRALPGHEPGCSGSSPVQGATATEPSEQRVHAAAGSAAARRRAHLSGLLQQRCR